MSSRRVFALLLSLPSVTVVIMGCGGKAEEPKEPAGKIPSYVERNRASLPPEALERIQKSRQQGDAAQGSAGQQKIPGGQ